MVLQRLLRAGEGKMVRRLKSIADAVNTVEEDFLSMTDAELRAETDVFRQRLADGRPSTTCWWRPSPWCARRPAAPSGSATSTSRSWAAPRSTWATSPRCAPVRARPSPACCRRT
jgi:hypothetical protein